MFGHQDDKHKDKDAKSSEKDTVITPDATADDQSADIPTATLNTDPSDQTGQSAATDTAGIPDDPAQAGNDSINTDDDGNAWQHPGEPIDNSPGQISDIIGPASGGSSTPAPAPSFTPHYSSHSGDAKPSDDKPDNDKHSSKPPGDDDSKLPHELIDIKQKALGQLTPLIDQLDQSPEDKFRTMMMMIQASDDQKLVKAAYEAADKIKDEKVRAQALLDIVNEINYFTQHPASSE